MTRKQIRNIAENLDLSVVDVYVFEVMSATFFQMMWYGLFPKRFVRRCTNKHKRFKRNLKLYKEDD